MMELQRRKKTINLSLRMNLLFFGVFLLFSILILRLGMVQIIHGEVYKQQVEETGNDIVNYPVPRGEIYDRNYNKIVTNMPEMAIIYTPPKNPQPQDLLKTAKKLAQYIQMTEEDIEAVTVRDKKDIWLLENKNGEEKITEDEEQQYENDTLSDSDLYKLKLERITEEELESINGNVASIYRKLFSAVALNPTIVKNKGVTNEEFAQVSENLSEMPGVDVSTDWQRGYPYDTVMSSVLGTVKQGLPVERLQYYTSKGYYLNDRYGSSYIEELYEDILRGTKAKEKIITNKQGDIVETVAVSEGQGGHDLVLTIDMELQAEVEKIIQEELLQMIAYPRTETLDSAFVVVMNPKTGELLTLAGKQYDRDSKSFNEYSHGTFTQAFEPGSAVKGATVLTGYQTGVLKPGDVKVDAPLNIADTPEKSSYRPLGRLNDLDALRLSSNVYMWLTVIDIMDGHYVPGGKLPLNEEKIETIRYYFSQFGLGVKTGIGFEKEVEGLEGAPNIDIAIGQLDTYTPIQLAQYVSTIANDGYRMKPIIVKEILTKEKDGDSNGQIVEEMQPTVLNRVDMKDEWIKRVQEGFWLVTHGSGGTASSYFANEPYDAAGKTGTAQSYKNGIETWNSSFVGYAPYDDPEVAISVIVPNAYYDDQPTPYTISSRIAQRVFRAYYDLKN
ncbi:penicillin-binding protein 2 [Caldibacillus lycopersici]|uniref:serine-type D-Ala-D-Ala carboxypeptidase n=1 Tax=Perspicuibacillus lycopersici TaxID=1325689 RepID=A0AAE3LNX2_9BACI|nr:penicillin-binding protein 2 [Perspicuibacillus lycopersici]MCU9614322.1 penicillin-binding protein 2 [Perspicuibacillus lycopersici]